MSHPTSPATVAAACFAFILADIPVRADTSLATTPAAQPAAAAPSPAVSDSSRGVVIPFEYDRQTMPWPLVSASIGGKPPMLFVLDTGTSAGLVLATWAADSLGLTAQSRPLGSGKSAFRVATVTGTSYFIGADQSNAQVLPVNQAYIFDVAPMQAAFGTMKVAGIIGLPAIVNLPSRFDFVGKTVTFYQNDVPLPDPGAITVPITTTAEGHWMAPLSLAAGQSVNLIVDTGSPTTTIPMYELHNLQPKAVMYHAGVHEADASYFCPDLDLASVSLADAAIKDVVVSALPDGAPDSLGLNVLTRFRVTFDVPHGQMVLDPLLKGKSPPPQDGWTGIHFGPGGTTVRDIDAGSPGAKAGVEIGDVVTAVDGHPAADTPGLAMHMLSGLAGAAADLTVQRGTGKPLDIKFKRADEFDAPKYAVDGLMLKMPIQQSITVMQVQKGCPGDVAGIQIGDVITSIDGDPCDSITDNQLGFDLRKSTVQLQVTRAGQPNPIEIDLKTPSVHG